MGIPGRGGLPHESNLRRGQGVGLVDEVAEGALQVQGFGGEGTCGFNAAGVFLAQSLNPRGGQRRFVPPYALHFADPSVGMEFGHGEKLVAGLLARQGRQPILRAKLNREQAIAINLLRCLLHATHACSRVIGHQH